LKKLKTFLQKFAKCEDQENLIPRIADKAKILGDKLPKNHQLIGGVSKTLRLTSYKSSNDQNEGFCPLKNLRLLAWMV